MTTESDRALVDALLTRRDEAAFGALYDRHTPYLYRFALRLTGGRSDAAQDVVHDAWVAAVERLASFEGRSALRTWLAGFVVNGVRRERRGDARLADVDLEPADDDPVLSNAHDRLDLERAIAALPDRARHVFVLHDVEGWTHEAIAERLGIEAGTSKSQLSRARTLVRRRLEPERETDDARPGA